MQNETVSRPKLRTKAAAAYLGLGPSTLEKRRLVGGGPRYIKLGKSVVYDVDDLEAWLAANKRTTTSQ